MSLSGTPSERKSQLLEEVNKYITKNYDKFVKDARDRYFKGFDTLYELQPEDLVSEAVVKLLKHIDSWTGEYHVEDLPNYVYLSMINNVKNVYIDNRRDRLQYRKDSAAYREHDVMGFLEVEERDEKERFNRVERAFIHMKDNGTPMSEIKDRLGMKTNRQYYTFTERLENKARLLTGDYKWES